MKRTLIVLGAVLLLAGAAWAQAPQTFLYQGRLTDADGAPLAPPVDITFSLWSDATGGSEVWNSGEIALDATMLDAQGMFAVELGPFTSAHLNGTQRWLQIQVAGEDPMTPRQLITSVPYAMSSAIANTVPGGAIGTSQLADNAVLSAKIADGTILSEDIANGTIQDVDLVDEPGLAMDANVSQLNLTTGWQIAASRSINIPTPGYVIAHGNVMGGIVHTTGTSDRVDIALGESASTPGDARQYFLIQSGVGSGTFFTPMQVQQVFSYNTPGTKSIYLLATGSFGTGHYLRNRSLILTFVPTNYGSVTPFGTTEPQESTAVPGAPPETVTD